MAKDEVSSPCSSSSDDDSDNDDDDDFDLHEELKSLFRKYASLKKKHSNLEHENEILKNENNACSSKLLGLNDKISTLENSTSSYLNTIESLKNELDNAKKSLETFSQGGKILDIMFSQQKCPTNKKGLGFDSFNDSMFKGTIFVKASHSFDPNVPTPSISCTSNNIHANTKSMPKVSIYSSKNDKIMNTQTNAKNVSKGMLNLKAHANTHVTPRYASRNYAYMYGNDKKMHTRAKNASMHKTHIYVAPKAKYVHSSVKNVSMHKPHVHFLAKNVHTHNGYVNSRKVHKNVVCYFCGHLGHYQFECYAKRGML